MVRGIICKVSEIPESKILHQRRRTKKESSKLLKESSKLSKESVKNDDNRK